jgi:predicted LPLAT superfamily acyltransferase
MPTTSPSSPTTSEASANWAQQGERGNMLALKLIAWIALHLGRRISRWVLVPVVAYFYISSPRARRGSRQFLSRIPSQSHSFAAVFRHLYTFAAVTLDRIYFLNGRLDLFEVQIKDEGNQALGMATAGTGLFLMGAHMGSFESVRSIARLHPTLKMVLLMYEENARNIKQLLHAINPKAQQDIISLGQASAMLQVRDQLSEGALIGVLADRSLDNTGNISHSFLGAHAHFPLGPFRLAAMLKHPVYFMVGIYEGGNRYTIHLQSVMDFAGLAPADREQATQQAMARYVQLIEQHCLANPYNWFNFFDFWQETPSHL